MENKRVASGPLPSNVEASVSQSLFHVCLDEISRFEVEAMFCREERVEYFLSTYQVEEKEALHLFYLATIGWHWETLRYLLQDLRGEKDGRRSAGLLCGGEGGVLKLSSSDYCNIIMNQIKSVCVCVRGGVVWVGCVVLCGGGGRRERG